MLGVDKQSFTHKKLSMPDLISIIYQLHSIMKRDSIPAFPRMINLLIY